MKITGHFKDLKPRSIREDNINIKLREKTWEAVNWMYPT